MLTYEDFTLDRRFPLGPRTITAEEIISFAQKYDPQPFHLEAESEQASSVGGLIASGWHTCAITMRMMCDAYLLDSASQGSGGLDEVRWLKPVRPGDTLTGEAVVLDRRVSSKRPTLGLVMFQYNLQNQNGETVITIKGMGMLDVANPVGNGASS